MAIETRFSALLLLALLQFPSLTSAQQNAPSGDSAGKIHLDVVVTGKSGPPVAGLQQQDFTVLDNKSQRPVTSFHALSGSQAPIEVILLVDAVNISYEKLAYARTEIDKFLRANEGRLAHPTTLAIFTDDGTQIQEGSSRDGNALSADLEKYAIGLRSIRRSSGIYGADERLQLSLTALHQLAVREAARPGRKIILWVSPGWPLLSSPNIELSSKQRQQIFTDIVNLSTELRQAHVTLYSIDPLGSDESLQRNFYYESFLKGVSKPSQVNIGDLALQVIATQTGGLALSSSNDVSALLQRSMADTDAYYELSFDPPPAEQRNEYHHVEVQVSKPGLAARTLQGYYAEP
jgi:VWFA-related protein